MNSIYTPFNRLESYGSPTKQVYAKHEYLGPTGSMKDRMVARALNCALEAGDLRSGMEIVEASSGNTGAALAYAGTALGFAVHIFVATTVSPEKIEMIKKLGGIVHEIEVTESVSEIELSAQYAKERNAYLFNQFGNPYHVPAYKETVAAEIIDQCKHNSVKIDHFVGGIGSGGSLRAIGEALRKDHNENLKIWATLPAIFPSDIEGLNPGHLSKQGHFQIWLDRSTGFENVQLETKDEDAFREIILLESAESISAGPASGACLHVAKKLPDSGNVLVLLTDAGWKYSKKVKEWTERLGAV